MIRRLAPLVALVIGCSSPPPSKAPDTIIVGTGDAGVPIATDDATGPSEESAAIPIASDDPVRGRRDALVTVVVFSDFQCPFCSRFAATIEEARRLYGNDLRVVFKNDPLTFHQYARVAAEVGQGVFALGGNAAFWKFHDTAFAGQERLSELALRDWAQNAGADKKIIEDGVREHRWASKIDHDISTAGRVGVTGTPCMFVNGTRLEGAQPIEKVRALVDSEQKKAKDLVATGVARNLVYTKMTEKNAVNVYKPDKQSDAGSAVEDEAAKVWFVPMAGSPARGPATAPVTIVEFGDFQCPYCKKVEATIEKLRAGYGDKVRVVWKDAPLPFHPRATPAAYFARSARAQKGDAGFWTAHDLLFAAPKLEDADLEGIARQAGLDVKKTMAAITGKTYASAVEQDEALGDDVAASGTPHFFINGRRLVGAQPEEKFRAVIDEEIQKAQLLAAAKVAPAAVYDALVKNGLRTPALGKTTAPTIPSTAPSRGGANAKVVIQVFSDFQCPFCKRSEPTIAEVLKTYGEKVKLVWRDKPLPMHANAPRAAEAAREALAEKGTAGFWKMHDLLFEHQDALERQDLEGYAKTVGLDPAKFAAALDGHVHKAVIDADDKAGTAAGVQGTPAFFIGSYLVTGAQPLSKIVKVVDRVLAESGAGTRTKPAVLDEGSHDGLVVQDVNIGIGKEAKSGAKVTVRYTRKQIDGTAVDASPAGGLKFTVGADEVGKGFDEGVVRMRVGGRRLLFVPAALDTKETGIGGKVPPTATLVVEMELLGAE